MKRIQYETESDRLNEQGVIDELSDIWRVECFKNPTPHYRADYSMVYNSNIVGFVEIKCRNIDFGQYPDIFISASKWHDCCSLAERFNIPFYFVVRCNNGIYYCNHRWLDEEESDWFLDFGGRIKNTRDKYDIEPVLHIPITAFKPLSDCPKQYGI